MSGSVAWISSSPVKGLRLQHHETAELTERGIPGDRDFFLVNAEGRMISATRLGPLLSAIASYDPGQGELSIEFPGGEKVAGAAEPGEPEEVLFGQLRLQVCPVLGPFSAALSEHAGQPLKLLIAPPERSALDRGAIGAVTLISVSSLSVLAAEAGLDEEVDGRRFRMNLGIDGLEPHAEDGWVDREIDVGEARLQITGNVGRCAVTTRDPDTGEADLDTLGILRRYRSEVETTEPLPLGVYARVLRPGRVSVGAAVAQTGRSPNQ